MMRSFLSSSPFLTRRNMIEEEDDRWPKMIRQLVQPLQYDNANPTNNTDEKQMMIESIVDDAYTMYERLDLHPNDTYQSLGSTDDIDEMNQNDNELLPQSIADELTASSSISSQIEFILQQLYIGCRNPQLLVRDRRKAFMALQQLLQNLQQFNTIHHDYQKNNHDQCNSLEILEEASAVHGTTLQPVLQEPPIIGVDGSNYNVQSIAIQTIQNEIGTMNNLSSMHLLRQQQHPMPSSMAIDNSHNNLGNVEMTIERSPTSDELLKAIFEGSSFVPETVGDPISSVPPLHNQSFATFQVLEQNSTTAATVNSVVHGTCAATHSVLVSESTTTPAVNDIAKAATQITSSLNRDAVCEKLTNVATTITLVPSIPPNQMDQSKTFQQELRLTGTQPLPGSSAVSSNDADVNFKNRDEEDKDNDDESIVTGNVHDMDDDNGNKNDDDQFPAIDGDDDDDDEEYLQERTYKKVSTSTVIEIPSDHIDHRKGKGMYPCLSEHLAKGWGIPSASREFLEPFISKTGHQAGRYIRCHLCAETLCYKMHLVKNHCDWCTHKERLNAHLQSVLADLKKKRTRLNDALVSRKSKRSNISINDHIYGPARTNVEGTMGQLIVTPVNSRSNTKDTIGVLMEDDDEILGNNCSDGLNDDVISMLQSSSFDRSPSTNQGNLAKKILTDEKLDGVEDNILMENSATLPCMPRKKAAQWGPFVNASRKYLKIYIASKASIRLVKCEICMATFPYRMKHVQDHCSGQDHQFQLKAHLYSEPSTQQSRNNIEYNPNCIPGVPPPPPPPPPAPQSHTNFNLHSSQNELSRWGPPLQPTTWQLQATNRSDYNVYSNQLSHNPHVIPAPPPPPPPPRMPPPPPPPPPQLPRQQQTESTGLMDVYQNVSNQRGYNQQGIPPPPKHWQTASLVQSDVNQGVTSLTTQLQQTNNHPDKGKSTNPIDFSQSVALPSPPPPPPSSSSSLSSSSPPPPSNHLAGNHMDATGYSNESEFPVAEANDDSSIRKHIDANNHDVMNKNRDDLSIPPIVPPQIGNVRLPSSHLEQFKSVIAVADVAPTIARTVNERCATRVTFNEVSNSIDRLSIKNRLVEWDPFWWNDTVLEAKTTSPVTGTLPTTDLIKTAASFVLRVDVYRAYLDSWGKNRHEKRHGKYSLLLRMLPLDYESNNQSRSDNHLWPKGTFIQLSNKRPISILQRKQMQHNINEWCNMSHELSFAAHIADPDIPTQVDMFCYDDQIYLLCVSFLDGFQRAVSFATSLISIDLDGDDDTEANTLGKFIVSLHCPLSRTIMDIPVRGKKCLHQQCFDLRNYLSINTFITGNRWRCAVCESFISVSNLQICGLTKHLVNEFRSEVTWNRDRVQFCSDGSYELLEPRKIRRQKVTVASWIAVKLENADSTVTDRNEDIPVVELD